MELVLAHALPPAEVRRRMRAAITRYGERFARYAPEADWKSQDLCSVRFKAKGVRIAVDVEVRPTSVVVRAKLPLLLAPFAGKARARIEAEAAKWLASKGPTSSPDLSTFDESASHDAPSPSHGALRTRS